MVGYCLLNKTARFISSIEKCCGSVCFTACLMDYSELSRYHEK